MSTQRVVVAVLVSALLAGLASAEPWRVVARGRVGLPEVAVDLGYADGFVSTRSSPIVLRIRTGDRPFDGYAGFHFATANGLVTDTPVLTRVNLAPHSERVFVTSVRVAPGELMVEWRNPSFDLIATRPVGQVPWQAPRDLVLPSSLSTDPGWYHGFARVITPIDHWFTLPAAVRDAIFRSGAPIVFFGVPRAIPNLTAVDRALLPVEFRAEEMNLEVPWPYLEKARTVSISWRAKPGTRIAGSPRLPYLVWNGVATYSAGDEPIRSAIPSFQSAFLPADDPEVQASRSAHVRELFREFRPLIVAFVVIPLSVAGWLAMRRRPRLAIVAALGAIALLTIGARDSLRAMPAHHEAAVLTMHGAGIVDHRVVVRDAGAAPLAGSLPMKSSITWGRHARTAMEVRTPLTAPGFGTIVSRRGWETSLRIHSWRDLGKPATVRTRRTGARALEVDYDSNLPVDYVVATWICGGRRCRGAAFADSQKRGTVTVQNGARPWLCLECRFDEGVGAPGFSVSAIGLITRHDDNKYSLIHHADPPSDRIEAPYTISTGLEARGKALVGALALPSEPGPDVIALVTIYGLGTSRQQSITLTGPAGTITERGNPEWFLPFGELRRIAPMGGIITVSVEPSAIPIARRSTATLIAQRRKP